MENGVYFRKCIICHEKTPKEKIPRQYVKCFCKLFNLPHSPYEDQLLEEAFFCVQCRENIGKINQLYQKLEKVKEDIANFRNDLQSQITQNCPPIQEHGKLTENTESKLITEISSGNILDTSEKLRNEIVNEIQRAVLKGSEKKASTSCASTNSENQGTETDYFGEIEVKIEAENNWSPPPSANDNNEWSDNEENRSDSSDNSYSVGNNIAEPSPFRRTTRSQTAILPYKKTRSPSLDTFDYSKNSYRTKRKLDVKVENESSCSESDEDEKPDILSATTISKSGSKKNGAPKKKLAKTRESGRKTVKSTEGKKRKKRSGKKVGSCVNWISCSRENCKLKFRGEYYLAAHIKRYHEGILKPYECLEPGCGKVFRFTSDLEKHQVFHSGVKSFVCEFCEKGFFTLKLLRVHRDVVHLKNFPLHCEICEKGMRGKNEMVIHMLKHNTQEKSPFQCFCGKRFSTPHTLKTHQLAHNDEFKCIQCNKSFCNKSALEEHNFKHNGLYPFKCTKCNFGTRQKRRLRIHMDGHEGIKVECKLCGKKVSEIGLPNHMKTHDPERPKLFVCEQCGKSFTDNYKLNRHAVYHKGEKSFKCTVCDKSFYTKDYLNIHMKYHEKSGVSLRNQTRKPRIWKHSVLPNPNSNIEPITGI